MGNSTRYDYSGAVYHVIPRSNNEEDIFPNPISRAYYLEKLKFYCEKMHFSTYCHCVMKTHTHLIVEQLSRACISEMMHALNTSYAMYLNKKFSRHGRLFCCKYKSLLIDSDRYLLETSRYIHNNPVKAEIVKKPEDYRWSSYRYYIGLEKTNFVNRAKILNIIEPIMEKQFDVYKKFVNSSPDMLMLTSPHDRGSTLKNS